MEIKEYKKQFSFLVKSILDENDFKYIFHDELFTITYTDLDANATFDYYVYMVFNDYSATLVFSHNLFPSADIDDYVNITVALNHYNIHGRAIAYSEICECENGTKYLSITVSNSVNFVSKLEYEIDKTIIEKELKGFINICKMLDEKIDRLTLNLITYKDF